MKRIKREVANKKCKNNGRFSCEHCGNSFISNIFLKEHIVVVHTHEFRYYCQYCGKGFYMECRKRFHEKKVHEKLVPKKESVPWSCDECGRVLANKYTYKQHKFLAHERELKFFCDKCGKGFPLLGYLTQHAQVHHAKNEPLICDQSNCGKVFKTKDALRRHQFIHVKDREFLCEFCPKTFIHIVSYKRHLREHKNGRKIYECDVCHKIVSSTTSLQDHMRTHTGEKPFRCSFCVKTFVSNKQLKVHIVVHTKEKKHICKICDKRFTQRGTLKSHFSKSHPNDVL